MSIITEFRESDSYKRIAGVEEFAQIHGIESYQGETVESFITSHLADLERRIEDAIVNNDATFGITDSQDRGSAIMIDNVLQIIKEEFSK